MVIRPEFSFIGGALCLDFVNTAGGRDRGRVLRDKLGGPGDLERWAQLAGLPPAGMTPSRFARAMELREALSRICEAAIRHRPPRPDDLAILNGELPRRRLVYSARALALEPTDHSLLAAVARSAADLLTSRDLARLRRCPGAECGWVFLDTSRNRSRQWCSMRVCGNRAKARNFRRRLVRKPPRKS